MIVNPFVSIISSLAGIVMARTIRDTSALSLATASFYSANFAEGEDVIVGGRHIRDGNISKRKRQEGIGEKGRRGVAKQEEHMIRECLRYGRRKQRY